MPRLGGKPGQPHSKCPRIGWVRQRYEQLRNDVRIDELTELAASTAITSVLLSTTAVVPADIGCGSKSRSCPISSFFAMGSLPVLCAAVKPAIILDQRGAAIG